jgi:hypothetical protein
MVAPTSAELAAGENQIVQVIFSPAAWDPVASELVIHSNDPAAATVAVALVGEAPPAPGLNLRNVPNPFNPTTEFRFNLTRPSEVKLQIYSLKGELVCTLQGGTMPAGPRVLNWNGQNERGHPVGSGAYVYRLYLGNEPAGPSRKLLLVR